MIITTEKKIIDCHHSIETTFFLLCHKHMYLYTCKWRPEEKPLFYFALNLAQLRNLSAKGG